LILCSQHKATPSLLLSINPEALQNSSRYQTATTKVIEVHHHHYYKFALMKLKMGLAPTLVYTPGFPAAAHPSPHETRPTRVRLALSTMGPPLSPWHESLPPWVKPAQNMLVVMAEVP
jgi:hypothetical protein